MRILLADNDRPSLRCAVKREGFVVETANASDVDNVARTGRYEIIVLNIDGPRAPLSLITEWRRSRVNSHIVVLISGADALERVNALEAGADCCLPKPYALAELLARLRAMARRSRELMEDLPVRVFDLEIHPSSRMVKRAGKNINLTRYEYALLEYLVGCHGKVVSRSAIWEHLYDENEIPTSNVVDVYIRYLRTKIDQGFDLPLILTVWGKGYVFREDGDLRSSDVPPRFFSGRERFGASPALSRYAT
jgi:DNA-binding response OmpR family regulator